jgi:hypothetical protein
MVPQLFLSFPFFFFVNFDFLFFFVFLKASNINVDLTRKISDCKIYALKVELVQNTFENLDSSEMTLKMLKMMQIYQKCIFWGFHCFFAIFYFSEILSKIWVKNWVATTCTDSSTYTKQYSNLLIHHKLWKYK